MSRKAVFDFLIAVAKDDYLQKELRTKSKDEVINNAKQMNYDFTDGEFDDTVWESEIFIANKRQENFDLTFSLWETMWGKYYFQYLIDNVIGSLSEQEMEQIVNR
ncbi:MAG: Nif11-like leader peptide family natural product precursor [Calothrix sp. MO_167.B12]|nr:Nif11-like leader peptide family natural product precursor [Calothrix sp. MO_167.B12]